MQSNVADEKKQKTAAWIRYMELMKSRPGEFLQDDRLRIETDRTVVQRFEQETGKTIGVVYESKYSMMVVDLVRDRQGHIFAYERLLPAVESGAVVMIPRYQGRFLLLKQFRHALRGMQIAFPRGFAEPGICAEENAKKELKEEIGAEHITVKKLGEVVPDSGLSCNRAGVFLCDVREFRLAEDHEGICDICLLTREELAAWIREGRITDGFTMAAFLLLDGVERERERPKI